MDEEKIYQLWLDYFRPLSYQLQSIIDSGERSKVVEFNDILKFSDVLAESLIDFPEMVFRCGESAIQHFLDPDQKSAINLRVKGLHKSHNVSVRNIRAENLGHLCSIEGRISRVTKPKPLLLVGVFICNSCGQHIEILQETFHFTEPLECPKDDGGCGKRSSSTSFRFNIKQSLFIDRQKVEIQEWADDLKSGEEPERISVYLEDDICGNLRRGQKIKIVGEVKCIQLGKGNNLSTEFDPYINGNSIEGIDSIDEIFITPEERGYFQDILREKGYDIIFETIYNSLKVHDLVRHICTLSILGGKGKYLPDGTWSRGSIHVLIVGDAGTGKTKIIRYLVRLIPGGQYTTGKSTSAAGLMGGVGKDKDWSEGRPYIEAGKMALADGAILGVDEVSDLSADDVEALKEGMEDEIITISKIAQGEFWCRGPKILGDNPKGGYFRPGVAPISQLEDKLSEPLKSRCDFIVFLKDSPDLTTDQNIACHKLRQREGYDSDDSDHLDLDDLRKLIIVAREFEPTWSEDLIEFFKVEYGNIRGFSSITNHDVVRTITHRQIDTLYNTATARARGYLRDVTKEDVMFAIELFNNSLKSITGGYLDTNAISSGMVQPERDLYFVLQEIIKQYSEDDTLGSISVEEIMVALKVRGIEPTDKKVEDYLKKLNDNGIILSYKCSDLSTVRMRM